MPEGCLSLAAYRHTIALNFGPPCFPTFGAETAFITLTVTLYI